ncbi:MAG: spermidine synthase [Archaeoglobi archaeon]|nr:spermidine synthase [Archaeoglobi archaeon]
MSEIFFCEKLGRDLHPIFRIKRVLHSSESKYQKIEVLESENFGKILVLDGAIQVSEKDEFLYHELLVHPVMHAHESPRNVLIIGGGDGGTLREVLKYDVERVDLVEIDAEVIKVARRYLKSIHADSFDDERVRIHHEDGSEFVRKSKEKYDVVIIDGPDPVGPGKVLYTESFYSSLKAVLNEDGFVVAQAESPIVQKREMETVVSGMKNSFPLVKTYWGVTLIYPGFFWCYSVGSMGRDPEEIRNKSIVETKFYTRELHRCLFNTSFLSHLSISQDG